MTTIVSSTNNPKERRSEKNAMKLNDIPVLFIMINVMRKVNGMARDERTACLSPRNRKSVKNTSEIVINKSRTRS